MQKLFLGLKISDPAMLAKDYVLVRRDYQVGVLVLMNLFAKGIKVVSSFDGMNPRIL